ncbi:MAG: hypothetical protein J6S60_10170 [Oscillospiraceae bacterium]|nr:hypothetical protein [Oscillospiraceae bacterium]
MWLSEFLRREGLELDELGAAIRRVGYALQPPIGCSDGLLYRLQIDKNFRTHPKIANLIASVCGITAEERDQMVPDKYRGQWAPGPTDGVFRMLIRRGGWNPARPSTLYDGGYSLPPQKGPGVTHASPERGGGPEGGGGVIHTIHPRPVTRYRGVVVIDRSGVVLRRCHGVTNAAVLYGMDKTFVSSRCNRRIVEEFQPHGVTFRYADEWDAMDEETRLADIAVKGKTIGGNHSGQPVVAIARGGEVRRFPSIKQAAEGTGTNIAHVWRRVHGEQLKAGEEYAYHWAREWDALPE